MSAERPSDAPRVTSVTAENTYSTDKWQRWYYLIIETFTRRKKSLRKVCWPKVRMMHNNDPSLFILTAGMLTTLSSSFGISNDHDSPS